MTKMLLIQNEGEAPLEGYTTLGFSSTRNCGVDGAIGQFGSGSKHAINLCLRHGLKVFIYCGLTRLEFLLEQETISDGLTETVVEHVCYRKGTNEPKRTGWVLDFGSQDWSDIGMGLREFVSNAIDRTLRQDQDGFHAALDEGKLFFGIVEDKARKAMSGHTRIYVEVNEAVQSYFDNLPRHFLHLGNDAFEVTTRLLPKADRNISGSSAVVYRRGVFVREIGADEKSLRSLFDYNMTLDEVKIDECRNSNHWQLKASCARVLRDATLENLVLLFTSLAAGETTFESELDATDIFSCWHPPTTEQKMLWQQAWAGVTGDAVVCDSGLTKEQLENRDVKAVIVPSAWSKTLAYLGVRSAELVLTKQEVKGRVECPATEAATKATNWAWDLLALVGLTSEKPKPEAFCFVDQLGNCTEDEVFVCDDRGVHFKYDNAISESNELLKHALEAVTEYLTGKPRLSKENKRLLLEALIGVAA